MAEVLLQAEPRTALGKKVRALRRSGSTPIHVYGRGGASLSLQAETQQLVRTLNEVGHTAPLTVRAGGDEHFVMVHEVQRHPVTERLLHVDLLRISRTERIHATVPIRFEGESLGAREEGALLSEDLHEIEVEALPTAIPHELIVDVSVMTEPDAAIRAGDLPLPQDVILRTDPDALVARVLHRRAATEGGEVEASVEGAPAGSSDVAGPPAGASASG